MLRGTCVVRRLIISSLLGTSMGTVADMKAMTEEEMGEVTGQGSMLGLDVNETDQAAFTRFTIGSRSELQMNMEEIAIGEGGSGADIAADHFSLGHISRDSNEIVPFVGLDPFLELAEDNGNVVGFRMGFTEAKGSLSGDFESLTGNVGIELEDSEGNVEDGQLLQADGTADNQRATHFGLEGADTDCAGQVNCAPLSAIQTLDVGERDSEGNADFTNDFFISFQDQDQVQELEWQSPGSESGTVSTDSGVFINIPTAMRLEMQSLGNETVVPRVRTEFIDRGQGLF